MSHNPKQLEFFQPLLLMGIFLLIVAVLFGFLAAASQGRQKYVYQTYNNETEQYIQQYQPQLLTLFNELFPKSNCVSPVPGIVCSYPTQVGITRLLPGTLKDWSSTAFLRSDQGKIYLMRLSGDTKQIYPYPHKRAEVLDRLLAGEAQQIPWDDYTYDLGGKEIVTSVKDSSGKVVGAIIRSVIEDNSF